MTDQDCVRYWLTKATWPTKLEIKGNTNDFELNLLNTVPEK